MQKILAPFSLLFFRLYIAYEFFDAGLEKLHGENWFASIQDNFPFPVNLLSPDLNWIISMSSELGFSVLLALGIATRLSALSLAFIAFVAIYSVHWQAGFNICEGGYKLVFVYLLILFALVVQGAGKISFDFLLQKKYPTKTWLKFL